MQSTLELLTKGGNLIGKSFFDIATYGPQLEDMFYASDPKNKLKLPLNLELSGYAIQGQGGAYMEIMIVLGY